MARYARCARYYALPAAPHIDIDAAICCHTLLRATLLLMLPAPLFAAAFAATPCHGCHAQRQLRTPVVRRR